MSGLPFSSREYATTVCVYAFISASHASCSPLRPVAQQTSPSTPEREGKGSVSRFRSGNRPPKTEGGPPARGAGRSCLRLIRAHERRYAVDEIVDADGVVLAEREFGGLAEQRAGQLLLLGELEFKGLNARLEEPLPLCPYRLVKAGLHVLPLADVDAGIVPRAHAGLRGLSGGGDGDVQGLMKRHGIGQSRIAKRIRELAEIEVDIAVIGGRVVFKVPI